MNRWTLTVILISAISFTLIACSGDEGSEAEVVSSSDGSNLLATDEAIVTVDDEGTALTDINTEDSTGIVAAELPTQEDIAGPTPEDSSFTPMVDSGSTIDMGTAADGGQNTEMPPLMPLPPGLVGEASPNNDFITEALLADVVDETGASVSLDQVLGHWTVLWFYPKANTSG